MRRIATVVIAAAVLLTASAALAATGTDPQDTPGGLDIASSSIRIVRIPDAPDRVRIAVSTYDAFDLSNGKGSFYWQLDTYGNGAVDYVVYMFGDPPANPPAPMFCLVKSTNPDVIFKAYERVNAADTRVVCVLPRRELKMTKAARWRVAGRLGGVIDRAPDTGWYGG